MWTVVNPLYTLKSSTKSTLFRLNSCNEKNKPKWPGWDLPFTSQAITLNQYTKQASDEVATKSTNKPYPVVKTSCKDQL